MSTWRQLDLKEGTAPPLLVRADLNSAGYTIQLTDLSQVWAEELSTTELINRATNEGCSIDPSESGQLGILQDKLRSALDQEHGTSISLTARGYDGLSLQLTTPLPDPLPRLEWCVRLQRLPIWSVGRALVLPLLSQAQGFQHLIQQLVTELHDKDRVIEKITDRLESSGNDLTTVFPGVSHIKTNRKRSQREQLARHVKGLTEFNETSWRAQHPFNGAESLSNEAWDSVLAQLQPPHKISSQSGHDGWWKDIDLDSPSNSARRKDLKEKPARGNGIKKEAVLADDEAMEGVDFQRQATPPQPTSKGASGFRPNSSQSTVVSEGSQMIPEPLVKNSVHQYASTKPVDGDTTDDEDDLDGPSQQQKSQRPQISFQRIPETQLKATNSSPSPPNSASQSKKKLGTLGGKKPSPAQDSGTETDVDSTRSITSKSPSAIAQPELKSEQEPEPPKPRSKLGRIGGQKKATPVPESVTSTKPTEAVSPKKPVRLGVIGGKKHATGQSAVGQSAPKRIKKSESPERSRPAERVEASPVRETSAERADRRRNELKQGLQNQVKAPAKKRRKF